MSSANQGDSNGNGMDPKIMTGAAVVGGVAATLIAGPVIGVIAAGGAAYAATRSDKVGEAAKATGGAAVAVGGKVVDINKEHKVTDKIGDGLKKAGSALQSFDSKHDVSGKTAGAITAAGNWITKTLQSKEQNAPPPPPPNGHQGVYRR